MSDRKPTSDITNHQVHTGRIYFQAPFDSCIPFWTLFFSGARQSLAVMKWLASVRSVLAGGSRSAPVTPAASPNMPSKADLRSKQVSRTWNRIRMLDLRNKMFMMMVKN